MLTLYEQIAGRANCSSLAGSRAGEAAAVFSKGFTDHQTGKSILIADLEVNGALDLVVLSEPHDDRARMSSDLALQRHRLALCNSQVL